LSNPVSSLSLERERKQTKTGGIDHYGANKRKTLFPQLEERNQRKVKGLGHTRKGERQGMGVRQSLTRSKGGSIKARGGFAKPTLSKSSGWGTAGARKKS